MNEELNEILEFYSEEKLALEKLINNHVKDGKFKKAHLHQKALHKLNQTLSLLKKLENPNYEEIEQLEFRFQSYSNSETEELIKVNPRLRDIIEKEKKHFEEKINRLSQMPLPSQIDGQDFDDLIFKMVDGKIRNFQFFINLEKHIFLDFQKTSNYINVTIPKYKKLKKSYILSKTNIMILKGLGFTLDLENNLLFYKFNFDNFKNSIEIKTFVSRVIYEGFGYHNIQNSSLMVIIN